MLLAPCGRFAHVRPSVAKFLTIRRYVGAKPQAPSRRALAARIPHWREAGDAPVADEAFVERPSTQLRLGAAATRRRWPHYATGDGDTPICAPIALQLVLWGRRAGARVVGIFARWRARWQGAAAALTAVRPKSSQGAGSSSSRARSHGNLQAARRDPTLVATIGNAQAPEAVPWVPNSALDAFWGRDVIRGIDASEKTGSPRWASRHCARGPARAERALPIIRRLSNEGTEANSRPRSSPWGN